MVLRRILRSFGEKKISPAAPQKDLISDGEFSANVAVLVGVPAPVELPIEPPTLSRPEMVGEEPAVADEPLTDTPVEPAVADEPLTDTPVEPAVADTTLIEPLVESIPAEEKTETIPTSEESVETTALPSLFKKKKKLSKSEGNSA